jgi:beta-glucosidase
MAQASFHFPRGFLWGAATASHQVEGNNTNNDWWAWENEPGHILHGHHSGLACDWWGGRWREDFDRAESGRQNAQRLSIEWSRIQPEPDRWDEDALDRYREMLQSLKQRGMTPMITLHHFTNPLWLSEMGGWENEAVVEYFEAYVRKSVEALHEYANLWVTINEPNNLAALGFILGEWPPGKRDFSAAMRVMSNLVGAHAAAYHAIHSIQPTAKVGTSLYYRGFEAAKGWSPLDRLLTVLHSNLFNESFPQALSRGVLKFPLRSISIPEAKGTQDFLGIDYYTKERVAFDLLNPGEIFSHRFFEPEAELSETGFIANKPEGMEQAIRWGLKFGLPIIITENGVDDSDDSLRPQYLIQHLHRVWKRVNQNAPVKGYFHWTLVDNFEWERGWTQRFGLWELDVETQARRKRPSADLYTEICQENGISSDMVARYAPQLLDELFPD